MNNINNLYAKLSFRWSTEKRFALYRKLASLLRNDFTLMDALSRIEQIESKDGAKPDEPFAIAMRSWQEALERGSSFADATRSWVPANETLMLTLGDVAKLSSALENVVFVGEGTSKIKMSLLNAFVYPLFLLILTFGIIIMVGIYLVPPLTEAAAGEVAWSGVAASLVWLSGAARAWWHAIAIAAIAAIVIIYFSFANWSGRLRAVFDNIPPWNMYKVSVSVGWLMSLSAIVSAGGSLVIAMKMLSDNSSPYLRDILDRAQKFMANGDNLGQALAKTNRGFPNGEIIGDLAIYADMNDFDQNVQKIASAYLDDSTRKMEKLSSIMNSIGILLVSAVIGWVVFGTFQMQEQITSVLA